MRTLLTALLVVVWCAAFGQSSSEVKSVATIAELMARKGMAGELVAVSAHSTNVPWSKPRLFTQYSTSVVTNAHDGVHYVTNARPSSVYVSSDKTAEVQLPEWWGAAVDDGVDDSAAIKSALSWGPTVQLSEGLYNVGGNVNAGTAILMPSNRSLLGVPGTKIAVARGDGSYTCNAIRIVSVTNAVVSGIEIYSTPAVDNISQITYGILVASTLGGQARDILIENCIAHDLTTGFDIAGSGTSPVINSTLSRCIAYDCINNGAQGVYGDGLKILDCEFYSNGGTGGAGYGFDLETNPNETTSNVIFARNRSYNNVTGGLAAVAGLGPGGTNIVFVENEVWNNPYGINVNGQESTPYNGVTLTGNKFHQNSVRGFVVSRSRQVKVTGNASDGDDSNAIDDVSFIDISGNTFRNSTNEALEFQSVAMTLNANVSGNMMYRPGTRGINASLVAQSAFVGNVIESPGGDGLYVGGADNRIADNQILGAGRSAEGSYAGLVVTGSRNSVGGNVIRKFERFEYGYAQAATNNTITLSANASGQSGYFTNAWVGIVQGTGAGQLRQISSYNGSTKVATVSTNWATNPTTSSVYQIGLYDATVVTGSPASATSDTVTLGTWATGSSQRYTGGFIRVTAGTGSGQERLITSYTSGREATINTAWSVTPDTNSTLVVSIPRGTWRGFVITGESQVSSDNNFVHGGMALDFLDAGTGTSLSPKLLLAESAPTFGTYRVGDIAFNSDPDSGEPSYWVCSVSGDPGTWTAGSTFGSGSLPTTPTTGDIAYYNGSAWSGLNIGTNGTYLGVSSSALTWLPMNTDSVIIDGRTEALNELLMVDSGENIYLRPHRAGGLSTSIYLEALRGKPAMRLTEYVQRMYVDTNETFRLTYDGLRLQPAGVTADPSYALDVVGTTSLSGNVTVSNGSSVTFGGQARTNWPSAISDITGLQTALDARQATNANLTTLATLNGSSLTNLNGTEIRSGTVADARIDSAIARDSEMAALYQPLDADLTSFSAGTAIATAQTNAVSWSAPLLYVGTTNVAQAIAGKQASASILDDLSSIAPVLGALIYYNGANWVRFPIGNDGDVLKTSGTTIQWGTGGGGGSGTVTNVALAVPDGFTVSGSPITTGGTITIGGILSTNAGGTGITNTTAAGQALLAAVDAAAQRTILSVTNYQAGTGLQLSGTNFSHRVEAGTNIVLTTNGSALVINSTATSGSGGTNVPVAMTILATTGTVTNSTTNEVSLISGGVTANSSTNLAANSLSSGAVLRLKAHGVFTSSGNYPNAKFRFKVGGYTATAQMDEPSSYDASSSPWTAEVNVTVSTSGTNATVRTYGTLAYQSAPNATANETGLRVFSGSGTLDTTSSAALDFTFESDPTATMTMVGNGVAVELLGQNITVGGSGGGTTNLVSSSTNGLAPQATLANAVLATDSSTNVAWTQNRGTRTIAAFRAQQGEPPASNYATFSTRNNIGTLLFDPTTQESIRFRWLVPNGYTTTNVTVVLKWTTSATSGDARWGAQNWSLTGDIDSDSFGTAVEGTTTTSGTAGTVMTTTLSAVSIDSAVAGDWVNLEVYRDVGDAADTINSNDLELHAVEVRAE